jgi:hypothetical protein
MFPTSANAADGAGQRDPHQPPVGHFFLAKFTAPTTAGARAIAPPSWGVDGNSTRLERPPLLRSH